MNVKYTVYHKNWPTYKTKEMAIQFAGLGERVLIAIFTQNKIYYSTITEGFISDYSFKTKEEATSFARNNLGNMFDELLIVPYTIIQKLN